MVSEKPILAAREPRSGVLILVLVEDGLGVGYFRVQEEEITCLNPCFSGRWSRSSDTFDVCGSSHSVLILVLVEDGLGVETCCKQIQYCLVLILVLVEDGLGVSSWSSNV